MLDKTVHLKAMPILIYSFMDAVKSFIITRFHRRCKIRKTPFHMKDKMRQPLSVLIPDAQNAFSENVWWDVHIILYNIKMIIWLAEMYFSRSSHFWSSRLLFKFDSNKQDVAITHLSMLFFFGTPSNIKFSIISPTCLSSISMLSHVYMFCRLFVKYSLLHHPQRRYFKFVPCHSAAFKSNRFWATYWYFFVFC